MMVCGLALAGVAGVWNGVAVPAILHQVRLGMDETGHVSRRQADARLNELIDRVRRITNPPLYLGRYSSETDFCTTSDTLTALDGRREIRVYQYVLFGDRADKTMPFLSMFERYWSGRPAATVEQYSKDDVNSYGGLHDGLPGTRVVWSPDGPSGTDNRTGDGSLDLSAVVYADDISADIEVTGQCVINGA